MRCSVARRATATSSIVRVRTPGDGAADADERLAEVVQARDLVLGELERHGDHGVDALAQQEVLEDARPLLPVARQVVEREVVPVAEQRLLRALEHRGEEPAVEERDDHADVAGATRREARGVRRDDVPELRGRLDDLRLRCRRDVTAAAEGARNRRGGDPRELRDLFDAGHGSSFPASPSRSPASPSQFPASPSQDESYRLARARARDRSSPVFRVARCRVLPTVR